MKVLGPEHPDTIQSIYNLGICLDDVGQGAAAVPLIRQDLEFRTKVLGLEHRDTINALNTLAMCLNEQHSS